MNSGLEEANEITVRLTESSNNSSFGDEDIDTSGIVGGSHLRSSSITRRSRQEDDLWDDLSGRFGTIWRHVPSSWSVERSPKSALHHLLSLLAFLSLCIFVFSVPSLLFLVSPIAPTPPGTAPNLDEAASMISGKNGAVAADNPICSDLGVKVLRDLEGNAVDAMVTAVLCQGILSPFASGIGGGAFILIHSTERDVSSFYDARETAPMGATMSMFRRSGTLAKFGGKAIAVPGELLGLYKAHKAWGKLDWSVVVNPAIEVAENAKVGKFLALKLRQMNETIFSSPSLKQIFTKRIMTKKGKSQQDAAASLELPGVRQVGHEDANVSLVRGVMETFEDSSVITDANDKDTHGVKTPTWDSEDANGTYTDVLLEVGDRLVNKALVSTLKRVSEHGPKAFYQSMSATLAMEVQHAGGIMTSDDIKNYKVVERQVVSSNYQGFEIIGAPVPSTGGVSIALALNMIRELQFRKIGRNNVSYRLLAETMKWVSGARMGLGDPQFVRKAERQMLYLLTRRESWKRVFHINREETHEPRYYSRKISSSILEDGTSHVSILDKNGIGVSVTSTINLAFGAGVVSNCSGAVFNDGMDAFTTSVTRANAFGVYPSGENRVEGGKRAASSMSPTMVLFNRRIYLVLGGSGGPKAISGVLQTLLNMVDYGDSLSDAISAPRIHHQLVPNVVSMEGANESTCEQSHAFLRPSDEKGSNEIAWGYWPSVCEGLKKMGHKVEGPAVHGAVQAVVAPDVLGDSAEGKMFAASDPRRIGKAAAY